jgi:hypothetical protein
MCNAAFVKTCDATSNADLQIGFESGSSPDERKMEWRCTIALSILLLSRCVIVCETEFSETALRVLLSCADRIELGIDAPVV